MSGAPTATTLFLSLPTAINYSDGTSDTLPANTLAVLPDATTEFDRTHDVYVGYTLQRSGVLSLIKESHLPTLTGDYAPICRVELHGIKPYQPEPYLAGGGAGAPAPSSAAISAAVGSTTRALALWNGSSNDAPPTGWADRTYDDSAWGLAADASPPRFATPPSGCAPLWSSSRPVAINTQALVRQTFVLPAGTISAATLVVSEDDDVAVYVNGTALYSEANGHTDSSISVTVGASLLLPGVANVVALHGTDVAPPGYPLLSTDSWVSFRLDVSYAAGAVADPGGHEGDLLYYHAGAWTELSIGTSGQRLASDGSDPYWATGGSGTVTSVACTGPTGTTVSGSPITSSGTLSLSWASQSANTFLGAPSGSSGAPTFRVLVGADIPVDASTIVVSSGTIKGNYQAGSGISISGNTISATGSGGTVSSVALSMPGIFAVSGSPVTGAGTLAVTLATQMAATVLAGPLSGSAAAPAFRALQSSDLPAAAAAGGHIHAHSHFL